LPIDALPELGKTSGRAPWASCYDKALLATVEAWARPDCERFGYDWPGEKPEAEAAVEVEVEAAEVRRVAPLAR
jgi:hypothetical protein